MTPFRIRQRLKRTLISIPGPVGSLFFSILGPAKAPSESSPTAARTSSSSPTPPDPRKVAAEAAAEEAEETGRPKPPTYTLAEEKALKDSTPSARPKGTESLTFWQVAKKADIPLNGGKKVKALDREYAVFNVEGEFFAIENACPHSGGSLGDGDLSGKVVTCNDHGWSFDVTTGACVSRPGNSVNTAPVRFDGERILLPV